MTEIHLPEEERPASGPLPTSPPPRPRRSRRLIIATSLCAAAIALAVGSATFFFSSSSRPGSGSSASRGTGFVSTQVPAQSSAPLTSKAVAAKVDPGLVDINVVFGFGAARGAGTGMVLTPSGVVLTNNHVIRGSSKISVTDIGNGRTYSASVIGYDAGGDIALLQLHGASGLQTVPLGDSTTAKVGDTITALGNALGRGGTPRLVHGRITALDRSIVASDFGGANAERLQGVIGIHAPIQPGDSGGPLVNDSGQVIGMDAAAGLGHASSATRAFAIPIDTALSVARQIESGVASHAVHIGATGFLGVQVVPPQAGGFNGSVSSSGAMVAGVLSGYPAQKAGLTQGDVITGVDGQSVRSADQLTALLAARHPGDLVHLRWLDPTGGVHAASVTLVGGPPA